MHHFQRLHLLGLLLILLAVWLGRPATSRVAAASSSLHCGGWSMVKSPNPDSHYDYFTAVAADSPSDLWAVGYGYSSGPAIHTLIEHYDGSSWQVVANPRTQGSALAGVAAISATDVWAVGYAQDEQQPLIEHWDGSQWRIVGSPNPGDSYVDLEAVSAVSANDVWAVGYNTQGTAQNTLIEHFDGSTWKVVKSPSVYGVWNFLNGVTALSSTDVWAVGQVEGRRTTPLSMHWNGTKWQMLPVPYHSTPSDLKGVTALSSTDVWAVGFAGGPGYSSWHWDGSHWKKVPSPQSQYGFALAVSASRPNNIWSVGTTLGGSAIALASHWDGTRWKEEPPVNPPKGSTFSGVVMTSAHTVWAVGTTWSATLVEYYC